MHNNFHAYNTILDISEYSLLYIYTFMYIPWVHDKNHGNKNKNQNIASNEHNFKIIIIHISQLRNKHYNPWILH